MDGPTDTPRCRVAGPRLKEKKKREKRLDKIDIYQLFPVLCDNNQGQKMFFKFAYGCRPCQTRVKRATLK